MGRIFRQLGTAFTAENPLNGRQQQAFRALAACRTAALGGAVWQCRACGHRVGVFHSCRDRHCPRCQAMARFRWVAARVSEVLPVPYFHTVFTLPHELNGLIRTNMKATIGCLFRAVTATLKTFAADPKYLGAEPGLLMVLHTWGRTLNFHVHIHCIVTGGGLSRDRETWVPVRHKAYLFNVKALSMVFRGKYLDGLEKLVKRGEVFRDYAHRKPLTAGAWQRKRGRLCARQWVVYAKPPFGGPVQVIKYLGTYTHRVGIADSRLVAFKDGRVSFRYKDYKRGGVTRTMTLPAVEFGKRFLAHILPNGLMRIRYGGLLASCKKRASLEACRRLLGEADLGAVERGNESQEESEETGVERTCQACGERAMVPVEGVNDEVMRAARRRIFGAVRGPP